MIDRMTIFRTGICTAALLASAAFAQTQTPPVNAAPDSSAISDTQLEDIVVTSERREASLQRVPISVTALTTGALESKQVVDVVTLSKVVPGMQSKPTLTPLEISVAIRGVTQLIPSLNVDPAIGTYIDGVYNVINAGSNNAMIDMERVEVLKGPQGTLFGRNTIGGAISITTAKPKDRLEGSIEGTYGNYDAWSTTAMLNAPIVSERVAARVVYQHTQHDGYGRNLNTGAPTSTFNQDYVRGSIRLTPSDDWDILVGGFYANANGFGFPQSLQSFSTTNSLAPGILPPTNVLIPALSGHPGDALSNYVRAPGSHDSYGDLADRFDLKQYGFTGTIDGKLGDTVSVKSITAYSKTNYNTVADLDGTPYEVIHIVGYPIHAKQFSQELQFFGDAFEDRLKWIGGAYFFNVKGSQRSRSTALTALTPTANQIINDQGPKVDNKSYSAFAQLTYEITDALKLTGGARYVIDKRNTEFHDHKENRATGLYTVCALANAPFDTNPDHCVFSASAKYTYVPFTIGLDYQANANTLLYVKLSRGYRSGAYNIAGPAAVATSAGVTPAQAAAANTRAIAVFAPVSPERLISPEAGLKLELLNRKLRINSAVYYSQYSNLQVTTNLPSDPGCPTCTPPAVLANSGSVHIYGGELEVNALLGRLQIDASAGYTHPKYVAGPSVGTPVINVSKFNGAFSATYPIETSAGTLSFGGTYSYRSKGIFYTLSPGLPTSLNDTLTQKGFGLLDGRISFAFADAPITIAAYGQNITKKRYIASATSFGAPLSFTTSSPGTPRTYGVSAKYSF